MEWYNGDRETNAGGLSSFADKQAEKEAEELSDRIGIMKDGKLLFIGNKNELYSITKKDNVEEAFIQIVCGGESNE